MKELELAYKNKSYNIFAIYILTKIDGLFVNMHMSLEENYKKNVVGKNAINKVKEKTKNKKFTTVELFGNSFIFSIAKKLFEYTEFSNYDENKNKILNRNVLLHGISKTNITKKQCKFLLILYYNLLYFRFRYNYYKDIDNDKSNFES